MRLTLPVLPGMPGRPRLPRLQFLLVLLVPMAAALSGCATPPPTLPPGLLDDALFSAPQHPVDPEQALAVSPAMREFVARARAQSHRNTDLRATLLADLQAGGPLRLTYDSSVTRTAAEAFEARAGNCLSLALMTAALARELGLQATLQDVQGEDSYTRLGDLVFASGHVNLLLARPVSSRTTMTLDIDGELTVDFLPGRDLRGQRVRRISDATAKAMYMNNRAAEALEQHLSPDAYWWARGAVLADPGFEPALNTLAVVYLRHGHLPQAERVLRSVLERSPKHLSALANLVQVLGREGRAAEADIWARRLQALQPHPPFQQLDLGRAAFAAGDLARALDLFSAELRQQPHQPEVHFWLAVAHQRLGDVALAEAHLAEAADHSSTPAMHALYAGKLQRLREASRPR